MKVIDFFCLNRHLLRPIALGFLMCYALPTAAKPPSAEAFNQPQKLVLTLSDKYFESNIVSNNTQKSSRILNDLQTDEENSKAPNIGCGMDVTPLASSDASFGNRVVGKCKLSYQY